MNIGNRTNSSKIFFIFICLLKVCFAGLLPKIWF
nr:MAG TPA: hypothetical protein [Caudoviricetes sp.]